MLDSNGVWFSTISSSASCLTLILKVAYKIRFCRNGTRQRWLALFSTWYNLRSAKVVKCVCPIFLVSNRCDVSATQAVPPSLQYPSTTILARIGIPRTPPVSQHHGLNGQRRIERWTRRYHKTSHFERNDRSVAPYDNEVPNSRTSKTHTDTVLETR